MLNESNIPLEEDGIEEEILVDEEVAITKAMWGDIGGNIENQTDLQNALDAKQDSLTESQLSAVNSGITSEKVATYDGYADQIARKANQSALNAETIARGEADTALGTRIDNEALARQQADNGLQTQIDAITSKSDVVDVVANYAALQAYDTSTLSDKDVVKVLDDETHEDALTYYRWSTTNQTWSYIGQEAPYYSKGQMDVKLAEKQDKLTAGANIQIQNGTISATDTTYTAGNGLNLNGTEFIADTDVLATKEDLEGYYTKPEADNLLAPKLEAEVVAELPATGAEGKLYLTPKAHTAQTATGNPITATVAEEAGKIESFQLDGDTEQQTYSGKNLCPTVTGGFFINNTANRVGKTDNDYGVAISVKNDTSYTISSRSNQIRYRVAFCDTLPTSTVTVSAYSGINADNTQRTITINSSTHSYLVVNASELSDIQVEEGSTATSYEPFVGGQPSPSPDYPQPIQTVTGLQTISINGTDYPLDLGTIELCGLGDDGNGNPLYKDRIYPDGDDWKVHKALNKTTLNGSEDWFNAGGNAPFSLIIDGALITTSDDNLPLVFCDKFYPVSQNASWSAYDSLISASSIRFSTNTIRIRYTAMAGLSAFQTWLASNNTTLYYVLATPTDTTITDQTLIAQLEAIRTASLQNGANTITNSAPAPNLAGDMEIGYYGFNPTNRYDKFIWLDLNNAYEQLNNPDTSSTLSTLSTRSLGTTTEQPTVTRNLETETITLKKGETEPIEDKTELPTILDEEAEETETTEPEESDGTDER